MEEPVVSFCRKDIMSACTASDYTEQTKCEFYEKSRSRNQCMYFIFDEYCDCLKAQMKAKSQ